MSAGEVGDRVGARRFGDAGARERRPSLLMRSAAAGGVVARGGWGGRRAVGQGAPARGPACGLSLRGTARLQGRRLNRCGADVGRAWRAADRSLRVAAPHRPSLRPLPLPCARPLVWRHLWGDPPAAAPRRRPKPGGGFSASAGRAGPLRLAAAGRPSHAGRRGRRRLPRPRRRPPASHPTCRSWRSPC
jgi:hypothetical protein